MLYALCPTTYAYTLCPRPMPILYAHTLCPYSMLYVYVRLHVMSCLMFYAIYVRTLHNVKCIFNAFLFMCCTLICDSVINSRS
jgi:hypothetical protein